jgi:hypothetical protein
MLSIRSKARSKDMCLSYLLVQDEFFCRLGHIPAKLNIRGTLDSNISLRLYKVADHLVLDDAELFCRARELVTCLRESMRIFW